MSSRGEDRQEPKRKGQDATPLQRLDEILEALQGHSRRLRSTWHDSEAGRLALLAGQLRAAAVDSDADSVGESASQLQEMLLAEEAQTSALCEKVESLIQLCRRGSTDPPKDKPA